ncbi:phage portal protein [Bacillus sp. C15(2022)]|uniref:phage portal protein n=1 Tax=Bacillus sp. C15(2022) TaxID=2968456 RepID=UPI003306DCC6
MKEMDFDQVIKELLDELKLTKHNYDKKWRYYKGDHDILHKNIVSDPMKSDMRVYFNYCRKMVQNSVGYLLGKPVNYNSKTDNKEFLSILDYYFSQWEHNHNISLKIASSINGHAYEVNFINSEGDFQCAVYHPSEMIVLYDNTVENRICLAVRKYKIRFDKNEYIDVWDNTHYRNYRINGEAFELLDEKQHLFSRCPVRELRNNDSRKSTFEDIMRIVDLYNAIHSASAQEIMDHRNAYLVFQNANIEVDEAKKMRDNGIIVLPNQQSKVYWLTKDINASFVKDELKMLQDEMYIQSQQVNLNENFQSNTSGVSIRLKLQELENQSAIAESHFDKVLKDRLRFFCEYIKMKKNKEFDYKDINITFTRNVPVDEVAIAQMVANLNGIVPHEDLLARLPFIANPSAAMEKLLKQNENSDISKKTKSDLVIIPANENSVEPTEF